MEKVRLTLLMQVRPPLARNKKFKMHALYMCINVIKSCFFSLKTEFSSDSVFKDEPTSPKKPPELVIDLSKDDDTNLEVSTIDSS